MRLYKGVRSIVGCKVTVTDIEGNTTDLPIRQDLVNHSPGHEWGYRGSGPSQLALDMVAYITKDDKYAVAAYQEFRDLVIAKLKNDNWVMTEPEIREFC